MSSPVAFHMPGHKLGAGLPEQFFKEVAGLDVTEIPGTDNLHHPESSIKEAQELAAIAFGSDHSFFLVNGSSCGLHAAISTICKPGGKLIVARDCHVSVINIMMLLGINPVYIKPVYDAEMCITTVITPQSVEKALREYPDAVGVLITRPNYYGFCSNITEIARIVHMYNKVLVVDEAHGAHLVFNQRLPVSAMEAGADIAVQSAHKTLPVLTQGSYLHVRGDRIDIDRLKYMMTVYQTTSPSYIIMSSLDIGRAIMQSYGDEMLGTLLEHILWLEGQAEKLTRVQAVSSYGNKLERDSTRIVFNVGKLGKTGYQTEKLLRQDYNIQVEMSDYSNVVCIATIADKRDNFTKLLNALEDIETRFKENTTLADIYSSDIEVPKQALSLNRILEMKAERISIKEAVGRVAFSAVTPYPPGIPVICPGEIITQDAVEFICNVITHGGSVNGIEHGYIISVCFE